MLCPGSASIPLAMSLPMLDAILCPPVGGDGVSLVLLLKSKTQRSRGQSMLTSRQARGH